MTCPIDFHAFAQECLIDRPTSNLYFLLDHGGLPGLHRQLKKSSVEWVSLFEYTNEASALAVAPILILIAENCKLQMSRYLFEWIGENGTYNSTVITLSSPLQIEILKKRLTARLDARISEDMRVMLRFFDPRTFEDLMSVLRPIQITTFLSPAEKWWYVDRAGKLVSLDATFNVVEELKTPLTLNANQEFDLIDASEPDRVLAALRENALDIIQKQPLSAQHGFVRENIETAKKAGLTSVADLVLYNIVALMMGMDFIKSDAWLDLLREVKSKSVDFLTVVSSLGIDD